MTADLFITTLLADVDMGAILIVAAASFGLWYADWSDAEDESYYKVVTTSAATHNHTNATVSTTSGIGGAPPSDHVPPPPTNEHASDEDTLGKMYAEAIDGRLAIISVGPHGQHWRVVVCDAPITGERWSHHTIDDPPNEYRVLDVGPCLHTRDDAVSWRMHVIGDVTRFLRRRRDVVPGNVVPNNAVAAVAVAVNTLDQWLYLGHDVESFRGWMGCGVASPSL